ncbi:aromatic acid exporter family protein [Paenibacillus sp. TRM 82003]|nr:aromatic acid exporter family protein [Paenibacillus sp. TRM 82003]
MRKGWKAEGISGMRELWNRPTARRLGIGKRIAKTGAAVFLTSLVCDWLGWPSIFAVIAAIVTIEPTISASIRKSRIRLPSAAIGAFFAMLFDFWLGPQPLTYTLSALATIYVIQLLRWNDSLLVATLTAVNMITYTDNHFLGDFFIRLGTTTVGLFMSASINFLLFPPSYKADLAAGVAPAARRTLELADDVIRLSLGRRDVPALKPTLARLSELQATLAQLRKFVAYEIADLGYRRTSRSDLLRLMRWKLAVRRLQQIGLDLESLLQARTAAGRLDPEAKEALILRWDGSRAAASSSSPAPGRAERMSADASAPPAPDNEWCCRFQLLLVHCRSLQRLSRTFESNGKEALRQESPSCSST